MLTSLAVSDTLQTVAPHGHDSSVYTMEVNGTHVIMTRRSASARDRMYLEREKEKHTISHLPIYIQSVTERWDNFKRCV